MTASRGLSILLVEDSDVNREIAQAFLTRAGHRVEPCASGEEALRLLDVQARPVDLVLMDIRLPGMDGVETTRRIRRLDGPAAATPVLALTANDHPAEAARCRAAGLNGVLNKPLRRDAFDQALAALLDGGPMPAQDRGETAAETLFDEARIDLLRDSFTEAKLAELFATARSSILESAGALRLAWRADDPKSVSQHAHRLAGAAANFACQALSEIARAIEQDCAEGGNGLALSPRLESVLSATVSAFPRIS